MTFKKYCIELLDSIENIDSIIREENFSAYQDIKVALTKALNFLLENKKTDAEKQLLLAIRLLMEAPPKNKEMGMISLVKIDSVYKGLIGLIS